MTVDRIRKALDLAREDRVRVVAEDLVKEPAPKQVPEPVQGASTNTRSM